MLSTLCPTQSSGNGRISTMQLTLEIVRVLLDRVLGDFAKIDRDYSAVLHLNWANQQVIYTQLMAFTL